MKIPVWIQILALIILALLITQARFSKGWYGFVFLILVVIVTSVILNKQKNKR
jgi:hypothetical protein